VVDVAVGDFVLWHRLAAGCSQSAEAKTVG
jgi:hypothetical protein